MFGLLGPNGAGKTTTVEILEGLRPRSRGRVSVLGYDPGVQVEQLKDRIGRAGKPPIFRIRFASMRRWTCLPLSTRETPTTRSCWSACNWERSRTRSIPLSGGQKQRVALALALVNDPSLLFLDEPTTGLDPQVRLEIHGLIQELKENKRTILLTTHYIEEAERLCDRVAIIDSGKIIELGTPREIQERTLGHAMIEISTNEPVPMNQLPESLSRGKNTASQDGRSVIMQSDSPAKTIVEAVKWIDSLGLELVDIHLKRPTLEDVFIELTGKRLRES